MLREDKEKGLLGGAGDTGSPRHAKAATAGEAFALAVRSIMLPMLKWRKSCEAFFRRSLVGKCFFIYFFIFSYLKTIAENGTNMSTALAPPLRVVV